MEKKEITERLKEYYDEHFKLEQTANRREETEFDAFYDEPQVLTSKIENALEKNSWRVKP